MKRVGIYIRVSTEEQARIQDGSLVSQKNRLLEYVEFQNKRESNWGPGNENLNFKEKEGKLIPFSPTQRVGSSTDGNGAP